MSMMRVTRWAARGTVGAALLLALFPVYWIVLVAFRPREDIFTHPVALLPGRLTLDNIRYVWFGSTTNDPVLAFLGTSFLAAGAATVLATALGVMAAYAMARHRVGGKAFSMWVLSQRFLPPVALVVPLFMIFRALGLFDTAWGLILLYTTFNIPMAAWLMIGFVESLPAELEEAAMIDGASPFQAFRKIVLPLLKPGIAVTALFTFIFSWNEYILAYQLTSENAATVTVYLPRLRNAIAQLYGEIAAASLLSVLPAMLFAGVLQKYLVRGLVLGGGREL